MAVNLTPIMNNDTEYEKLSASVAESFNGEWDDTIHDSYLMYLKHIQENARRIHVVRCKAETLEKEIERLEIDELKKKVKTLCEEADSI